MCQIEFLIVGTYYYMKKKTLNEKMDCITNRSILTKFIFPRKKRRHIELFTENNMMETFL